MSDTDRDVWVSWDQYHALIESLALKVYESDWKFDQIICLARGGMRVGDVLSRLFRMPLAILSASSYRENAGRDQGQLDIAPYISMAYGKPSGRVLLVDDMVDSGLTFGKVRGHLLSSYPQITEMRTAVIWWKARSVVTPDYYAQYLPTDPWIHQPFENYDEMTLEELRRLHDVK
ncbi:phosphoribosyltransferase [Orrella sp. 11846]|uniref:phosphoribosyltransferase n=1 Tax=Orrella sp. 11846 TaxID=3409913 RepID=UPI003B5B358A